MSDAAFRALEPGTLARDFFARPAIEVAPELIGKLLVRRLGDEVLSGRIVEVEAYMGAEDSASHAFRGPSLRNHSMFGPPGHLYVYRSYGIHACANVVTSAEGTATAVLLRALEPLSGLGTMQVRRGTRNPRLLCSGPGRLCQALGIELGHDGADLLGPDFHVQDALAVPVTTSSRIGISSAQDRLWRFIDPTSRFLSRPHEN